MHVKMEKILSKYFYYLKTASTHFFTFSFSFYKQDFLEHIQRF